MVSGDILIRNARVVHHNRRQPRTNDLLIQEGRITAIGDDLMTTANCPVIDAEGRLAFPGLVDAHQHWGIYGPISDDAETESMACLQGGVTTALNYIRTGSYYFNRGGSYTELMPDVLEMCEGRSYVDYAFHLAPLTLEQIAEIPHLTTTFGVTSYKIFMFYGGHGLHGRSDSQSDFLMLPPDQKYDVAQFERIMRALQELRLSRPELAACLSLSLHCETAEIMAAYTQAVQEAGVLQGLEAYSASRPPHSEGLAVTTAAYLAKVTGLANVNLLHLSSAEAMDAALRMARTFPEVDFKREVTIGHLLATFDTAHGLGGKVNPPLRSEHDRQSLWRELLAGNVDWVVSDHACCKDEAKFGKPREDVFLAKSGFGGAEYILSGLLTEGLDRGLDYSTIARITAWSPAQRFGAFRKGALEVGFDGDVVLVDDEAHWTVRAQESLSAQEYTPFEGFKMKGRVTDVIVRGCHAYRDGVVQGSPQGSYVFRPAY